MPGLKAVTFSGKAAPVSRRNRSRQPASVERIAETRRSHSALSSRPVRAKGDSSAAQRISSE